MEDDIVIDVPGYGEVAFPKGTSEAEMIKALKSLTARPTEQAPQVAPQAPQAAPTAPMQGAPVSRAPVAVPPKAVPEAPQIVQTTPQPTLFAPRKSAEQVRQDKLGYVESAEMGATPATAVRAGAQTQKTQAITEFAKARGIPESRYRVVNGNIVYQADDGKYYAEVPGLFKKPMTSLMYNAPDVAEAIPSVIAGLSTVPMLMTGLPGALGSAAITGGVSSLANAARQGVAGLLAGEERPLDIPQVATSGLLDAATQMIPAGRLAMYNRRVATDINKLDPQATQELARLAQERGITLTPAELTNLSSLKAQQKVLSNIPESGDTLTKFYEKRYTQQIQPAVDDFLSTISKVDDPMTAGFSGQKALQDQLKNLELVRKEATDPLYTAAFASSVPVDIKPVVAQLDNMLNIAKGDEKRALERIKSNLYREKTTLDANGNEVVSKVLEDRLPALQRVKFDIDAMLKGDAAGSMDKVVLGDLGKIKDDLLARMGKENPAYLDANAAFEIASAPINEFTKRRTGTSLVNIGQDNLNQFATKVFEGSPQTVGYVKKQIQATNPEAWDEVTRAYLQQSWEKAMSVTPGAKELPIDAGAAWRNMLLGDIKTQRKLQEALPPDQFVALKDLTTVLEAAGKVKKIGSDTAYNQKIIANLEDKAPGVFAEMGRLAGGAISPQRWGQFISDWASERAFAKNADTLANIITEPMGILKLRELRKMSPTSVEFWSGMSQLAVDYSKSEIQDFFGNYGTVKQ
jgi:hypothetical protein